MALTFSLSAAVLPKSFSATSLRSLVRESNKSSLKNLFSSMVESQRSFYTVAITGSTGLIGQAFINELSQRKQVNGKPVKVIRLIRNSDPDTRKELSEDEMTWNPKGKLALEPSLLRDVDAVIHLAGENISTGLGPLGFLGIQAWSREKKAIIMDSRVKASSAIAQAIKECDTPTTLIGASGVGIYGSNFFEPNAPIADEYSDTKKSEDFLAELSRAWEDNVNIAKTEKNRVVNARFGVVMSKLGGALAKLYPVFLLGGGGIVGSGKQYLPFISARDVARALVHVVETSSIKGPVNICAPNACTNEKFTSALGKVLGRPTLIPFPGFAVKLIFGEMGEEILLGGVRATPKKLLESGFIFKHDTIETALESAINEEDIN